jgi:hypothetical protein
MSLRSTLRISPPILVRANGEAALRNWRPAACRSAHRIRRNSGDGAALRALDKIRDLQRRRDPRQQNQETGFFGRNVCRAAGGVEARLRRFRTKILFY